MGCITVGVGVQNKVNNTGYGASYANSLFIYPGVICYVGDKWVTLELARTSRLLGANPSNKSFMDAYLV